MRHKKPPWRALRDPGFLHDQSWLIVYEDNLCPIVFKSEKAALSRGRQSTAKF
jgi:hypothetical protein